MSKKYDREFMEFSREISADVPEHLSNAILSHVKTDLNPSKSLVIGKLVVIQGLVGTLTMLFCPQFDLSLTTNHELYHFFHRHFGFYGCMAVCGALFMGSGAAMAGLILRYSELDVILSSKYLFSLFISGLAVVFFMIFGAEVYLTFAAIWILGGVLASVLAFDGSIFFRTLIIQYK